VSLGSGIFAEVAAPADRFAGLLSGEVIFEIRFGG
jgi:hypothetical protein